MSREPVTPDEMDYFGQLQEMSDEDLLQEWHAAISADDEQRIALAESTAAFRFEANWQQHYAARFPDQTYYQFPGRHFPVEL